MHVLIPLKYQSQVGFVLEGGIQYAQHKDEFFYFLFFIFWRGVNEAISQWPILNPNLFLLSQGCSRHAPGAAGYAKGAAEYAPGAAGYATGAAGSTTCAAGYAPWKQ